MRACAACRRRASPPCRSTGSSGTCAAQATGRLSGGTRQRLALAVLSLPDAPVLVLDEPGLSLDPDWRRFLHAELHAAARRGVTVLVATHLLGEWDGQADRCLVLEGGRVARELPSVAPARGLSVLPAASRARARGVMEVSMFPLAHVMTLRAAFRREIAEHRLNRFLHVHLALCALVGSLPLFTPDAAERSAPAWVLQAVLYCLSLSSLLLGLSAAQGDADEFPLLFTQPVARGVWLAGKAAALMAMLVPASMLLVMPTVLLSGVTALLGLVAVAAAGVCIVLALLGLAVGFWVRDHVRGLLLALASGSACCSAWTSCCSPCPARRGCRSTRRPGCCR